MKAIFIILILIIELFALSGCATNPLATKFVRDFIGCEKEALEDTWKK